MSNKGIIRFYFNFIIQNKVVIFLMQVIFNRLKLLSLSPLALLWFLTSIYFVSCYCPAKFTLAHSSCQFYYSYSDANCTSFRLDICSWQTCASSEDGSHCQSYQEMNSTNWNQCTSACCGSSKLYPYQSSSFEECTLDIASNSFSIMVTIVGSIIGVITLAFAISIFCCCKDRIYEKCGCVRGCCESLSIFFFNLITCRCFARPEVDRNNKFVEKSNTEFALVESSWSLQEIVNEKLNDVCSICLEGKPSLELECSHVFHRQCIISCINKKEQCALCRSKKFNKIKLYCELCFKSCVETTLMQHRVFLLGAPQICNCCKQIEERSIRVNLTN